MSEGNVVRLEIEQDAPAEFAVLPKHATFRVVVVLKENGVRMAALHSEIPLQLTLFYESKCESKSSNDESLMVENQSILQCSSSSVIGTNGRGELDMRISENSGNAKASRQHSVPFHYHRKFVIQISVDTSVIPDSVVGVIAPIQTSPIYIMARSKDSRKAHSPSIASYLSSYPDSTPRLHPFSELQFCDRKKRSSKRLLDSLLTELGQDRRLNCRQRTDTRRVTSQFEEEVLGIPCGDIDTLLSDLRQVKDTYTSIDRLCCDANAKLSEVIQRVHLLDRTAQRFILRHVQAQVGSQANPPQSGIISTRCSGAQCMDEGPRDWMRAPPPATPLGSSHPPLTGDQSIEGQNIQRLGMSPVQMQEMVGKDDKNVDALVDLYLSKTSGSNYLNPPYGLIVDGAVPTRVETCTEEADNGSPKGQVDIGQTYPDDDNEWRYNDTDISAIEMYNSIIAGDRPCF